MPTQRALQSDPGRFRGVLTFDIPEAESETSRAVTRQRVATLLAELESPELNEKPLKVLVALAARVLAEHESWAALAPEYRTWGDYHLTAPAVLVQIAAETEDERTYALRLVKRVFGADLKLREQRYGGRHLLSRESFGYRDAFVTEKPEIPQSAAAPGVSWLLYQPCVQDMDKFFQAPNQDDVIGRGRDEQAGTPPRPNSHIQRAHEVTTADGKPLLLRRSFGYETFDEVGLVFLASAAHAGHLVKALEALETDPLKPFIELKGGGIFVVPPSAAWLAPSEQLEILDGAKRPARERSFYPRNQIMLYEVTPSTLQFFLRVFHANKENFDEGGSLREDLKLTAKGLAKILYGAHLPKNSSAYAVLSLFFSWDLSEEILTEESRRDVEDLRRLKKNGAASHDIETGRLRLRQKLTADKDIRRVAAALPNPDMTVLELVADIIAADAEFISGSTQAKRTDFNTLIDLCIKAAGEARELNKESGRYMTFMC